MNAFSKIFLVLFVIFFNLACGGTETDVAEIEADASDEYISSTEASGMSLTISAYLLAPTRLVFSGVIYSGSRELKTLFATAPTLQYPGWGFDLPAETTSIAFQIGRATEDGGWEAMDVETTQIIGINNEVYDCPVRNMQDREKLIVLASCHQ